MHLISIGLFLLTLNVINANQYDPNEPLIAEASQHQSQFASAADINSVSSGQTARFPARFQAASSVSGHVNGKPFSAASLNNNGAVSRLASGMLMWVVGVMANGKDPIIFIIMLWTLSLLGLIYRLEEEGRCIFCYSL